MRISERVSHLTKLYAVYSIAENVQRFLGQSYLTENDLQIIEQSFKGQIQTDNFITLTDGDVVNINIIDSIEEIKDED